MISKLITIIFLYSISFFLAEFLYKKGLRSEYSRKVAHILGGFISLLLPIWFDVVTAVGIGIFFFVVLLAAQHKKLLNSVNKTDSYSAGAALFPLGLAVSFAFFVPINLIIFQGSVLILTLSDGMAGLLGYKFGKKKYNITGEKSWLGSFLFFIITLLVLLTILYFVNSALSVKMILFSIVGSLLLALLEGLLGRGLDNLAIPIASGSILYYLLYFL
ncbi:hypothetical protein HN670_00285 [bacterium]|jgi:phytol kinase|nr:hypothetical protein [bacterium]